MNHRRYFCVALLFSVGLLLTMAGTVAAQSNQLTLPAHAKVDKAIPAIGSTIAQAPTTVVVFTLENINPDPNKSNLFVYSPGGDLISQGNAKVALNDPRQMSVNIKPHGNGTYIVHWITVSAEDGDPAEGAFVFTVQPTAPASQTTTPPTQQTTGGVPVWVPVLVGLIALLVGLGGGIGLGRRGKRSMSSVQPQAETGQQEQKDTSPPSHKSS